MHTRAQTTWNLLNFGDGGTQDSGVRSGDDNNVKWGAIRLKLIKMQFSSSWTNMHNVTIIYSTDSNYSMKSHSHYF